MTTKPLRHKYQKITKHKKKDHWKRHTESRYLFGSKAIKLILLLKGCQDTKEPKFL